MTVGHARVQRGRELTDWPSGARRSAGRGVRDGVIVRGVSMRRYLLTFGVLVVVGLGMVGGGIFLLVQRATGARVQATVTRCEPHHPYGGGGCVGMWTVGGSLANGGRLVTGTIDGASSGDEGKTVTVTLSGNRAYTRSLTTPVLLLVLGIGISGMFAVVVPVAMRRSTASRGPVAVDAPRPPADVAAEIRVLRERGRLAEAAALADGLGPYGIADDDFDTSLGAAVVAAHAEQIAVTDPDAAREAYRRAAGLQRGFAAASSSGGEGSARMSIAADLDARAEAMT